MVTYRKKTSKHPRFRLWTFPVLVDGPFGVVSAAEFIGILLFVGFIFWAVYAYTMRNISLLSEFQVPSKEQRYNVLCSIDHFYCLLFLILVACCLLQISRSFYFFTITYLVKVESFCQFIKFSFVLFSFLKLLLIFLVSSEWF